MTEGAPRYPRLRGREKQWQDIVYAVAAVPRHRRSLVVIEGRRGLGRTRLLTELVLAARHSGHVVLHWGREPDATATAPPSARPPNPFTAVGTDLVVVACDTEPAGGIGWLHASTDEVPILWVVTRTPGDRDVVVPLAEADAVTRVRLDPLAPAAAAEMLADLVNADPSAELRDLAGVAAGNPGLLAELVAALGEENLLEYAAGRCRPREVGLPRRIRVRLRATLAQSSRPARDLVQVASVIGPSCRLSELAGVLRCGPAELGPAVEEALATGLLLAVDDRLVFAHELVRSLVAGTLPAAVSGAVRDEVTARHPVPDDLLPAPGTVAVGTGLEPWREPAVPGWSALTEQERRIADLTSQALTNREIAARLYLSPHTINYHLRQIFKKLGITSRVQLTHLAATMTSAASAASASASTS
jgi:DNA-binding CsgD family transcriptional regulator